jgi:hypothetical protein
MVGFENQSKIMSVISTIQDSYRSGDSKQFESSVIQSDNSIEVNNPDKVPVFTQA